MNIQKQRSNFSQFSDDLWLVAQHDDTEIEFEVDQDNLLEFSAQLVGLVDDCLCKSKLDTDELIEKAQDLYSSISKKMEVSK